VLEDDALARLYARLDDALWQIEIGDPTIIWRDTHE
jgi:hypothetical protein